MRYNRKNNNLFYILRILQEKAMKTHNKLFTPPHLIFTLLLALAVFTGCQVESDDSGNEPAAKISYTVKFDANGGSGEMNPQTAESGSEITLTASTFTREGYTFSGWNTKSDGSGTAHTDKSTFKLTADITLYAQWTEIGKVEKVTFSATGEVDYNDKITLSCGTDGATIYYLLVAGTDAPTAEKFSLSKQKYSEPLAITENAVIAAVAVKDGMKDSETATATFTVKNYTVTFETEHGTAPAKIEGLKKGDKLTEEQLKALENVTGYKFDGWFDGETQFTAEMEITSNLTLTAKWTKTYTVTFDANGGNLGELQNITEVAGTEITLPAGTEFTEDGFSYTFAGWNTKPNATGKNYSAGEKITLNSNLTFYAKWGLTAENALKKIEGITESGVHTVSVVGNVADYLAKTDIDTPSKIVDALLALLEKSSDARIILDLSGTDDLTAIPDNAFRGNSNFNCENLSGIILPQSVKSIGVYAFNTCINLVDVVLPKMLDSIGNMTFHCCYSLSEIVIPEGVQELGNIFENCTGLKNVTLPSSLRKLAGTFYNCSSLEKIIIPEGVEILGYSVFGGCSSLVDVTLPSTLKEFEESLTLDAGAATFIKCKSLKNIVIPDGVTKLPTILFFECSSLESITIPASVTEIGRAAFGSCEKLKTVNYKGTKSEWEAIIIDTRNSVNEENANIALSRATIICTDGRIEPAGE